MIRSRLLAVAVAALIAGAAVAAPPAPSVDAPPRRTMSKLDATNDGVIDRAEAATHPRLVEKFDSLDTNKDGRLDAAERSSWQGKSGRKGHHGRRGMDHAMAMALDTDGDGLISRAEVASHPRLAAKFDTLDANKDGRLDAAERPSWQGKHRSKDGHGRRGMADAVALDADGDGRISRAEAAKQPKFATRFDQADGNRDGYLVRSELQAWTEQRRGESMTRHREMVEAKFTTADNNRDGKLSRAEVETAMPHLAKAFAFHDEDRDGFLTRADLQPKPRR
jgi:Ca2+-binding EF-hand superfamily protein